MKVRLNINKFKNSLIEINSRITFVYGANGLGKTTIGNCLYCKSQMYENISGFLKDGFRMSGKHLGCKIEDNQYSDIYVYNDAFIYNHFKVITSGNNANLRYDIYTPEFIEFGETIDGLYVALREYEDFKEFYKDLKQTYEELQQEGESIGCDLEHEINELEDTMKELDSEIVNKEGQLNRLVINVENMQPRIVSDFYGVTYSYINKLGSTVAKSNINQIRKDYIEYCETMASKYATVIKDCRSKVEKYLKMKNEIRNYKENTLKVCIDGVNQHLENFGFLFRLEIDLLKIKIVINNDDGKNHTCNDNKVKESQTYESLSEGEKKILSFLYFIEFIKITEKNKNNQNSNKVLIVFDDVMSSVSSNYIWHVSSMIYDMAKQDVDKDIVLLSHHHYFVNHLINLCNTDKNAKPKIKYDYYVLYGANGVDINKQDHEKDRYGIPWCEYHDYWYLWFKFKDDIEYKVILPNIMRNILEYFSIVFCGNKFDNIVDVGGSGFKEFEDLYRFVNKESHLSNSNDDISKLHNICDIKKQFENFFEKNNGSSHFEAMKLLFDRSEAVIYSNM